MVADSRRRFQELWNSITDGPDRDDAVSALSTILDDMEGRYFISCLERKEADLCIKLLDHVSRELRLLPFHCFRRSLQGIAEYNLKPAERAAFLVTLRRLRGRHQLVPDRIRITEGLEVRDEILAFGGVRDVRCGTYAGLNVAVKTTRIPAPKDLQKIRKVSIDGVFVPTWGGLNHFILLQRFYREVVSWGTLFHPNILKLVGAQEDMRKRQFVTVSEWMVHGTIMEYIENYHCNRLELVRDLTIPTASFTQRRQ